MLDSPLFAVVDKENQYRTFVNVPRLPLHYIIKKPYEDPNRFEERRSSSLCQTPGFLQVRHSYDGHCKPVEALETPKRETPKKFVIRVDQKLLD